MSNSLIVVIVFLGGFAIASMVVHIIGRKWEPVPLPKYTVYTNGMVFEHCVFSRDPLSDGKRLITSDGMTLILGGTYAIVEEKWSIKHKEGENEQHED